MPLSMHPSSLRFTASVLWPILASVFWAANLIGLLLLWTLRDDSRQYERDEAGVVFISDVGAAHKALFIPGNTTTAVFYACSLLSERWLRHVDRIPGTIRARTRNYDIAATVLGILGGVCLIILAVFDAFHHSAVHWSFALGFIVCIAASAVCQTLEIWGLRKDHPERNHLWRNACAKMGIIAVALVATLAFVVLYGVCGGSLTGGPVGEKFGRQKCWGITSASAVCEWIIAFLYGFYLLTFVLDLWPAAKTSPRYVRRLERYEAGRGGRLVDDGEASPNLPWQTSPDVTPGREREMAQV